MTTRERSPDPQSVRPAQLILWLCLAADFAYILLHILYKAALLNSSFFSLKRDLGYSEFFQYAKYFWMVVLLIYLFRNTRTRGFLSWSAVFLYFLVDDAFQVHEELGSIIAAHLDFVPPFNLRLQDIGELTVYIAAGMILLPILALAFRRGSAMFRGISKDLLFLIVVLACFGVVVDLAEISADHGVLVEEVLALIDDGGEMLVTSVLFWYVFQLVLRNGSMEVFLHERLRIRPQQGSPETS